MSARTVTLPFMSFWTTANDGFPRRSGRGTKEVSDSSLAPALRDPTRSPWRLTKHLDEALGGFEEGDGVDAVSVDGHVDERLRAAAV